MQHRTPAAIVVSALAVYFTNKYGIQLDTNTQLAVVALAGTATHYLPTVLAKLQEPHSVVVTDLSPKAADAIAQAALAVIRLKLHPTETKT